ncbi:MAG: hypothetical protein FJY88_08155 [Candidatus Eisenbacteria bacterium]|nr:hypothetical protein [Candidatus Eisenbacteria bacterium]
MTCRIYPTVLLASFLIVAAVATSVEGAPAEPASGSPHRYPSESDLVEVLFVPDSRVRLRDGVLVDLDAKALTGMDELLRSLDSHEWSRVCDVPEQTLDDIHARGAANAGKDVYNLNNIYRLRLEGRSRPVDVWAFCRELEALPGVLRAYPVPLPMPPPVPPDYEPFGQGGYLGSSSWTPAGIDAWYAWTWPGGSGNGVTLCEIEYSWNYGHSDVSQAPNSQINSNVSDPFNDDNHGTAIIGGLVSDDNTPNWGTKGICYGARLLTCGSYFGPNQPSWNVPGALAVAIANLAPGDVILIEQQWEYSYPLGYYIPIEWWGSSANEWPWVQWYNGVYAAIENAISLGIHVVECGGNGNVNTDDLQWYGDSGAIIVGAGAVYPGAPYSGFDDRERLPFSSYGTRFNLQGWGENVVTTGYGDLYSSEGRNLFYTNTFSGTSSAGMMVAGAVACYAGYYLANVSPTPLDPLAMRALLTETGTPQVPTPGGGGNIGPRPNLRAAILFNQYEWGDAPETALAYPGSGAIGTFPTCSTVGPPGPSFVRHAPAQQAFFGPAVDFETDGNAGNCPQYPPYDADECWSDGDAGLIRPAAYTIDPSLNVVPCNTAQTGSLGRICWAGLWGPALDVFVTNGAQADRYVNMLVDWNQDGVWQGSSQCATGLVALEHMLVNLPVPPGYSGPLSTLYPRIYLIGPNAGFVWTRFTISDLPVPQDWNGVGDFADGETEDYLLRVDTREPYLEMGDAPEGALAYPDQGVIGGFPTCQNAGPAGVVAHTMTSGRVYLGQGLDLEIEGNASNCPNFPPYDADECANDADAGLLRPPAYTISNVGGVTPCSMGQTGAIGYTCRTAVWGRDIDITVTNLEEQLDIFLNVLIDWDQNGMWGGASTCPGGPAPEHVVVDLWIPPGYSGPLSAVGVPDFLIGPNRGFVWTRFTISDAAVGAGWDGTGRFDDGETSDFLLAVDRDPTDIEEAVPERTSATRFLTIHPNPFGQMSTISLEVAVAGEVKVTIHDPAGRRVRTLVDGARPAGPLPLSWDGRDDAGNQLSSGIYFVRARAVGETQASPIIFLRSIQTR